MRKIGAFLTLLLAVVYISGCALGSKRFPERLSNVDEAFNGQTESPPSDSHLRSVYPASYDDVFQAVMSSIALVKIFPENIERDEGYILGIRSELVGKSYESRFFYKIIVDEISGESTAVDVQTKRQAHCSIQEKGVGWDIASLGITTIANGEIKTNNERCIADNSEPTWASGDYRDFKTQQELHNMIRINLVNAGVL